MERIKNVINKQMEERCVTIGALAKKLDIEYPKLYKSLSPSLNRQLLATELLDICEVLGLTFDDFSNNTSKEKTA